MPVELDEALVALADSLEFPREADLAGRVMAELSAPAVVIPFLRRPAVRRAMAVAAAAIVIAGLVLIGSPRARRAVADLLGIGGIEIRASSSTAAGTPITAPPTFPTSLAPDRLGLGSPTAVEVGADRLGIAAPLPSALGPPAGAFFGQPPAGGQLTLLWPPSADLPATSIPEVGALLTVFRGSTDEGYLKKMVEPGTTYEPVTVNGRRGAWLAGAPHTFLYEAGGDVREETLRLAGNTLIWTYGPFTYRLESALDRDTAISVAESVPTR